MKYLAIIRKEHDSDFGVEFPDLPGCISAGDDLDEAKSMAAEALALHLEGLRAEHEDLPRPSTLGEIAAQLAQEGHEGDFVAVFEIEAELSHRKVRINVTLSEAALSEIDAAAARQGVSRSAFLQRAGQAMAHAPRP